MQFIILFENYVKNVDIYVKNLIRIMHLFLFIGIWRISFYTLWIDHIPHKSIKIRKLSHIYKFKRIPLFKYYLNLTLEKKKYENSIL